MPGSRARGLIHRRAVNQKLRVFSQKLSDNKFRVGQDLLLRSWFRADPDSNAVLLC